jgi:hypothetical protein
LALEVILALVAGVGGALAGRRGRRQLLLLLVRGWLGRGLARRSVEHGLVGRVGGCAHRWLSKSDVHSTAPQALIGWPTNGPSWRYSADAAHKAAGSLLSAIGCAGEARRAVVLGWCLKLSASWRDVAEDRKLVKLLQIWGFAVLPLTANTKQASS